MASSRDSLRRGPDNTIWSAAYKGDLSAVKQFVSNGDGADAKDAIQGSTALHWAAFGGHLGLVRWLVKEAGSNVDERNSDGCTPLFYACEMGHTGVAQWLVREGGAEVNVCDEVYEQTPLHRVCFHGNMEKEAYSEELLLWLMTEGKADPFAVDMYGQKVEDLGKQAEALSTDTNGGGSPERPGSPSSRAVAARVAKLVEAARNGEDLSTMYESVRTSTAPTVQNGDLPVLTSAGSDLGSGDLTPVASSLAEGYPTNSSLDEAVALESSAAAAAAAAAAGGKYASNLSTRESSLSSRADTAEAPTPVRSAVEAGRQTPPPTSPYVPASPLQDDSDLDSPLVLRGGHLGLDAISDAGSFKTVTDYGTALHRRGSSRRDLTSGGSAHGVAAPPTPPKPKGHHLKRSTATQAASLLAKASGGVDAVARIQSLVERRDAGALSAADFAAAKHEILEMVRIQQLALDLSPSVTGGGSAALSAAAAAGGAAAAADGGGGGAAAVIAVNSQTPFASPMAAGGGGGGGSGKGHRSMAPSIASTLDVGLAARAPHPSEAPSQHASTASADRKPKRTYSTNLDDLTSSSPAKPAGGATANEAATAAFAAKLAAALHDGTDTGAVARPGQRAVSSVKGLSADAAGELLKECILEDIHAWSA